MMSQLKLNNVSNICVTSYNSGGMGIDRQNFIKTLTLFSDILCVQEHFLLDSGDRKHSNTQKLRKYFGDTHDMSIKPAYKNNANVTRGRGSGGLVTMWKKCYTKYVTSIKSEHPRILATKFNFPSADILLFNLYFMVDPQINNFNENELMLLLAEIERLVTLTNCSNILLAGDLNCDFSRNTVFVNCIREFVKTKDWKVFWTLPDENVNPNIANVGYTYSNIVNNVMHTSVIDHFMSNSRLFNTVTTADVIHSSDNHSGHSPIFCKFNVEQLNLEMEEQVSVPRPSWEKANLEEQAAYKETLGDLLSTVRTPVQCDHCITLQCQEHTESIDDYAMDICEAVDAAARECLPVVGGQPRRQGRALAGWNEYVKPFQDESLFWHGLWAAAGSPNQGELFNLHRDSKMQYKYAVRRLKRATYRIQNNKFVEGLLQGGVNIFKEIKKFRGEAKCISSCIDGETGSNNISEHFAEIYQDLYSKHTLGEDFERFSENINSRVNQGLLADLDRVNIFNVQAALDKLKACKSDVMFGFSSDCLINSNSEFLGHITQLFKWVLRTGKVPSFLLLCTLVPIVKDNLADVTSSENYRAIAIGSLLLKWFDWLILILEQDKLSSDELQFGFQARSSTTMCSWAVSTVVDYYNRAGRTVFSCAMDLSKAFDLVAWDKMFPELVDRGISPLVLRCLIYVYVNQTCKVRWGTAVSHSFPVTNGVRQGAVSSPILFCIYINNLIRILRNSTLGCQLQGVYLGIWVYADDVILLAPSRTALQEMVKICESFAISMKLKFSTNPDINKSKTKCILFTKDVINIGNICPIMLNGLPLPFVDNIKHLGNILQTDNSMTKDCSIKRATFISKIHSLSQEFHFASPSTVMKLYNIYACSFHGSSGWDLYSDNVTRLYSSWNVAIRILFNLPRDTHRYIIEPVSDNLHVKTMLCSRFVSFFNSLNESPKLCIRLLANVCKSDNRSVLCKNLVKIANDCNSDVSQLTKRCVKENMTFFPVPDEQSWKIPILKELLDIRAQNLYIADFNDEEITNMINELCSG